VNKKEYAENHVGSSPREDEENPLASIILGLPAETWVCETEVKRRK
jgi:hypothetical protein